MLGKMALLMTSLVEPTRVHSVRVWLQYLYSFTAIGHLAIAVCLECTVILLTYRIKSEHAIHLQYT